MDIRRWKVMLAVSDAGSYTRAAEELRAYPVRRHPDDEGSGKGDRVFLIRKKRTGA